MEKFRSGDKNIELVGVSRCHPAFLNRQIIVLLLGLGVSDSIFQELQVWGKHFKLLKPMWTSH